MVYILVVLIRTIFVYIYTIFISNNYILYNNNIKKASVILDKYKLYITTIALTKVLYSMPIQYYAKRS